MQAICSILHINIKLMHKPFALQLLKQISSWSIMRDIFHVNLGSGFPSVFFCICSFIEPLGWLVYVFYEPDIISVTQPSVSKHCKRQRHSSTFNGQLKLRWHGYLSVVRCKYNAVLLAPITHAQSTTRAKYDLHMVHLMLLPPHHLLLH